MLRLPSSTFRVWAQVALSVSGELGLASAFAGLLEGIADVAAFAASSALTADDDPVGQRRRTVGHGSVRSGPGGSPVASGYGYGDGFRGRVQRRGASYTSALATSNQDEMASENAQQAAAVAEANAAAAASAASVAAATTPPTLNVTGPVSISNAQGAAGINWTNSIVSNEHRDGAEPRPTHD